MSMQLLSVIQFALILCAYFFLVMALPSLMFVRRLKHSSLSERFLFCMVAGNFYIITVVQIICLMGITCRWAVIVSLFGGALWRYFVTTDHDYRPWFNRQNGLIARLFKKELGVRYYIRISLESLSSRVKNLIHAVWEHFRSHIFEWVLFILITAFNIWYFSYQTRHYYGYGASDTVVHLNWIEQMANGKMFAAGVYPHGFHCMIYALYKVFGFELFVLMRYFGAIQAIFIAMMIYIYGKTLCKNKYAPFIAYMAFGVCQMFNTETMMRFSMTIPQEYGMIFLFPMIIYLSRFMTAALSEPKNIKLRIKEPLLRRLWNRIKYYAVKIKSLFIKTPDVRFFERNSTFLLTMAAISFSLTLTVHFYITICAGLMCVGFAIAYISKIFRRKIFLRLICAVMAACIVAIAPMAFAYARGNKLEGSLRWALSIITVGSDATGKIATVEADELAESESNAEADVTTSAEAVTEDGETSAETAESEVTESAESETTAETAVTVKPKKTTLELIQECYGRFVPAVMAANWFKVSLICLMFVLAYSLVEVFFRKSSRPEDRISLVIYLLLMFCLFNASTLGIPELMDKIRTRILIAYSIPMLLSCTFDIGCDVFGFLIFWFKYKVKLINAVAAMLCITCLAGIFATKNTKRLSFSYYLQHNGAIICLYDIVDQYPTNQWTIVSPVDETRMVYGNGYHYEIIDFLLNQENWNSSKTLYLPTRYVFFFVEKRVLQYSALQKVNNPLPDNLFEIKEWYAEQPFAGYASKSRYYQKVDRAIVMSKLYYWIQEYRVLFPNELEIYYEDNEFICYKIEQNVYHLNNFAINYGFNVNN